MRKVVHKIFFGWNYEKEEKWLNEMSAKGLQLVNVGICRYEFEEGEPNEYTYRYELLQHPPSHPEATAYVQFVEDTGAEHIGTMEGWAYFRKKTSEGEFNLFSDNASLASYYMRMMRLLFGITLMQLATGVALPAFLTFVMGGWHFAYTILPVMFTGFALLCVLGIFRLKKMLRQLDVDPSVLAGMADLYGKNSIFLWDSYVKKAIVSFVVIVFWVYLYVFLHEAGHALVAIIYGNTIDSFVVFGRWPHVSLGYPYHFTTFGWGVFFAGGALLPIIITTIAICFYSPKVKHGWYHEFFRWVSDILPFVTLIVWAGFPIVSLFAEPPQWEDVTRFMAVTGIHPLLVAVGTIAIVGAFWLLARKKGIYVKWRELKGNQKDSRTVKALSWVFPVVFVILVGFVFPINPPFPGSSSVYHTNATWGDIRLQTRTIELPVNIEESRMHSIDLRITGQGFLTAFSFTDTNGDEIFLQVGSIFTHSFGLGFDKGVNTISMTFLFDNQDIEEFFSGTGREDMIAYVIEYSAEVFAYTGDDFSFNLFIDIR